MTGLARMKLEKVRRGLFQVVWEPFLLDSVTPVHKLQGLIFF